MKIGKEILRRNRRTLFLFVIMTVADAAVFVLYNVMMEPLIYVTILTAVVFLFLLFLDYAQEKKRSAERERALAAIASEWRFLPEADTLGEEEYQRMIVALGEQMDRILAESEAGRQDMLDYYTAWVHQIKTPIAVMRLKLSEDTPEHHALLVELSRIEQYAEMALQYIRMSSKSNDLVIQEYELDELIRDCLRRLAPQFVEKKLKLCYEPVNQAIITDAKWFTCILDQLLSNAVKYTPAGSVTISLREGQLTVADTGYGIAAEDLPRIFEMGYTGTNGRLGLKSSGLGLYLAKKAADLLAIPLSARSIVHEGSAFTLDLRHHLSS